MITLLSIIVLLALAPVAVPILMTLLGVLFVIGHTILVIPLALLVEVTVGCLKLIKVVRSGLRKE